MPPPSPFGADFLSRDWPLLLESCSLPRNPAKIAALLPEVRDPESLFRLAEVHGVLPHLSAAVASVPNARISDLVLDSLRARCHPQLLFTLAMTAELFRILDLLRRSGVELLVVKGPVLALRAYGDPAARRYVDLDFLVRQAEIPRAAELLVAAGYESRVPAEAIRAGKIPGEYRFRRPGTGIILELHTERTFRHFPRPLPIEKYFQHKATLLLDGHGVPALSPEHEFVLISIHGAKDFWERLIWISDIAAIVHNHPELDWERIRQHAADVGAERMVRMALLLAQLFLRVQVPPGMKREVEMDSGCSRLVREIETWLPYGGYRAPQLARRALFRFGMHGRFFASVAYLIRLSVSTTEDDWPADVAASRSRVAEMFRRQFRLAKKYRNPNS